MRNWSPISLTNTDVRDELKYRLSLRGAALLAEAETSWEPNKSRTLLQVMYDARSSIVHNGKLLVDLNLTQLQRVGIPSQLFPQQCENIVRAILKTYILRRGEGQTVTQVNQELESRIVESLSPS